jgi:hypothetical protein
MKNRKRLLIGALVLIPLCVLALVLPIPVASSLEENDNFCTSCHLAPEETYVARSLAAQEEGVVLEDLASGHYHAASLAGEAAFRCIDCHRGDDSFNDRASTLFTGARDALTFLTGGADETIEKAHVGDPDLLERACLKCHVPTLMERGFNNHYHNQLPQAKAALEAGAEMSDPEIGLAEGDVFTEMGGLETTVTCSSCHLAHPSLPDGEQTLFMDLEAVMFPACVQCHEEVGHGPVDL